MEVRKQRPAITGRIQRVAWHATARQFRKYAALYRRRPVKHAGGGVISGVTRRQYRRQITAFITAAAEQTGVLEDQRERADADVFYVVTQQAWVGIRNDSLIIRIANT